MRNLQSTRRATTRAASAARGLRARILQATLAVTMMAVPVAIGVAAGVDPTGDVALASTAVRDSRVSHLTGVARSTYARDVAWTIGGAGNGPNILGVDPHGRTAGYLRVSGAKNRDWQDIAAGPRHRLWVVDSSSPRRRVTVYRIWEPSDLSRTSVRATRYRLSLPDGPRAVEALLVHPRTGRVFVATTESDSGALYKAPRSLSTEHPNRLTRVSSVPADVSGGSFAPSGRRMVLVNDHHAYLYAAPGTVGIDRALSAKTVPTGVSIDRTGQSLLMSSSRPRAAIFTLPFGPGSWPTLPVETLPPLPTPPLPSTTAPTPTGPSPTPTPSAPPSSTVTPSPSGNPATSGTMQIGLYSGSFSSDGFRSDFGAYPAVESTYLNADQVTTPNLSRHEAQIDRGISPIITLGHKNGPFTRAEIAAWGADVQSYFTTFVAGLAELSRYAAAADNGTQVYFADEHEAQIKINQDKYAYQGYGTSQKPTTAQSAAAWNKVMGYVRTAAPDVVRTYWYGGSGANENTFAGLLEPALIQVASFDPYRWRHNSAGDTPQQLWGSKVSALKAQPWMKNPDGSLKPWGLTEWGTDASLGDASNATFVTAAMEFLRDEGAAFAVYFNRVDGNDNSNDFVITDGSQPLTLDAFRKAFVG